MPQDRFSISYSKVSAYRQCRKKYWYSYLSGLARPHEPMNVPGLIGNAVHKGMRVLCETLDPALGLNEIEVYLRMPGHEICEPGTDAYERAIRYFEGGVEIHNSIPSAARWAEKELSYRNARTIEVTARVDRIDRLQSGEWQIIDWKTGADMDDQTDEQLDLAHVAARSAVPQIPAAAEVVTVAWNLRKRSDDSAYHPRVRLLRREDAVATVRRYRAMATAMQETTDFPAMPGRYCSFCPWRDQCPEADAGVADWEEVEVE